MQIAVNLADREAAARWKEWPKLLRAGSRTPASQTSLTHSV